MHEAGSIDQRSGAEVAFGIYVHWPFCAAKCPYCDFNSHVRHKPVDQAAFVEAYEREIAYMASLTGPRTVSSIFFGGGTPSLMDPATVERILTSIGRHWSMGKNAEITLEANPTSVEAEKFKGFRSAGVNRLSLGLQSLDDRELKFLGRQHTADEAKAALAIAREAFPRISFDMIYSRPGQSPKTWEKELTAAIDMAADHMSLYQLTIEEGTPFFNLYRAGKMPVPDQDTAADLYALTLELTRSHGLSAYEISNHAVPGGESRHNLIYWRYQDYAGIGPGAHGRLTLPTGRTATATARHPESWWQQVMVKGHGLEETSTLTTDEAADEFLLMGLRLDEGIDPRRYAQIGGRELTQARIELLREDGFLETTPTGRLRATHKGFIVLDAVVADISV
jgi:putative oxygen-independent coproporphyrinogen III oxidase